jgi:hypothetical protein
MEIDMFKGLRERHRKNGLNIPLYLLMKPAISLYMPII